MELEDNYKISPSCLQNEHCHLNALDLPLNSGPGEKQARYLSIHGLTAAEMQVMHRNLLVMPCIARVVSILKALGIPENYQK